MLNVLRQVGCSCAHEGRVLTSRKEENGRIDRNQQVQEENENLNHCVFCFDMEKLLSRCTFKRVLVCTSSNPSGVSLVS